MSWPFALRPSRLLVERALLVFLILAATGFGYAGIKKNLPFTPEADENIFVGRALDMVEDGDPNPHWFGNPGSTLIYPLAAGYAVWHAVTDGGALIPPDPAIRQDYDIDADDYYYLGRALTIFYYVGAVFLTYVLGKRAFNGTIGLIAALLIAVNVVFLEHAQIVRTDSVATFFGLLGLWRIVLVYERPTTGNRLLAGASIGLAVSSRYFLLALLPVLAIAELLVLVRKHVALDSQVGPPDFALPFIGPLAGLAAFAATTPYFFLDFSTAWDTIENEARGTHLGADGLSRPENFAWYVTSAIPDAMTAPVAILALMGGVIALLQRRPSQLLCLAFLAIFVVAISYSRLHWQRWLIPVLPIIALLAGLALYEGATFVRDRLRLTSATIIAMTVAAVALLAAWPSVNAIFYDIREASSSTRVLAREWIIENLEPGSRIAGEFYTAPLGGVDVRYSQRFSLFSGVSIEDYENEGVRYIVASSDIYDRYYAEPERYGDIVSRYDALFEDNELLKEFRPGDTRGGPVIRIYEIAPADPAAATDS